MYLHSRLFPCSNWWSGFLIHDSTAPVSNFGTNSSPLPLIRLLFAKLRCICDYNCGAVTIVSFLPFLSFSFSSTNIVFWTHFMVIITIKKKGRMLATRFYFAFCIFHMLNVSDNQQMN